MSFLLIREYQEQLVSSENRFRSLVEQSPLSIQIINRQGQTIRTNPAWQKIFSHYPIIFDLKEQLQEGFTGTAQSLTPKQYQIPHKTGPSTSLKSYWLRGYLYPLWEQDRVNEVVVVHEDITEQTRLENAMHFLVEETSSAIGDDFFEQLVKGLAKIFEADYVLIGLVTDYDLVGLINLDLNLHFNSSNTRWDELHVSTLAYAIRGKSVQGVKFFKGTSLALLGGNRISSRGCKVTNPNACLTWPEQFPIKNAGAGVGG